LSPSRPSLLLESFIGLETVVGGVSIWTSFRDVTVSVRAVRIGFGVIAI
jgi:hypothetical protein